QQTNNITHIIQSLDLRKTLVVGPINKTAIIKTKNPIEESCNFMCAINYDGKMWISQRTSTNDAHDFGLFVKDLVKNGALSANKFLIIDNSPIHGGAYLHELYQTVESVGAKLIFLPKYSPELNPIELVFAFVKNNLRHRQIDNFHLAIIEAFQQITLEYTRNIYRHCLHPGDKKKND
ncbi:hypothetical protein SAMD00019534_031430, partial [Acytostelium subglobosum LB1]|uniref:hypothetical protein n=1 Tax=Acytostelium subglobosum LB1 TaxID=1410327 RepID=UPI000644D6D6